MGNIKEQNPHSERDEEGVDKVVEDSFPASDPPSTGGVTRIETDEKKDDKKKNRSEMKKGRIDKTMRPFSFNCPTALICHRPESRSGATAGRD
jgi:hypothetical protein